MFQRIPSDVEWAGARVERLPKRWQGLILGRWNKQRAKHAPGDWAGQVEAGRDANISLRELVADLEGVRLPLDANDADICQHATEQVSRCMQLAMVYHHEDDLHAAMRRVCIGQGIEPPKVNFCSDVPPAIKRMTCGQWWRRKLRKMHARAVEGAAIMLGYVNKARECYVSNESVKRREQQNARNAETLESTTATNENGQEYTLAELAATGPANKAIRRAELMTRIAGFERIAIDLGHVGLFFTVTCPSRMHKWKTRKGGGVMENSRYDGTLPMEAQKYHAKTWARIRASLKRQGIQPYGFRIAEPNHDGTPHWHVLVFMPPAHVEALKATVWHYALADSPDEPGARAHRCDFKAIDAGKGTAAGYIAKYVAKNIDGYRLEADLYGNDAITASQRVETWAATWGIRQFQQIGGAPVGPWRELRRVEAIPAGAPQYLIDAHEAVNRIADIEAGTVKSVAWDRYTKAQGGVFCGRRYRVRVDHLTAPEGDKSSKYGEPHAPKPIGVTTNTRETWFPEWMAHMTPPGRSTRVIEWPVASKRYTWTLSRGGIKKGASRPWTCVNNCTESEKLKGENDAGKTGSTKTGLRESAGDGQVVHGGLYRADFRTTGSHDFGD